MIRFFRTIAGLLALMVALYAVAAAAATETILHAFGGRHDGCMPLAGLLKMKGVLYGTSKFGGTYGAGTVFKIDTGTDTLTVVYSFGASKADGAHPYAGLLAADGILYGTTSLGGPFNGGTVFAIAP